MRAAGPLPSEHRSFLHLVRPNVTEWPPGRTQSLIRVIGIVVQRPLNRAVGRRCSSDVVERSHRVRRACIISRSTTLRRGGLLALVQ